MPDNDNSTPSDDTGPSKTNSDDDQPTSKAIEQLDDELAGRLDVDPARGDVKG